MLINVENIITDENPLVREKSLNVELPLSKEDEQLLLDMLEYVKNSTIEEIAERDHLKPAVGISAIQLGIKKKLVAIVLKDAEGNITDQYALANPRIVSHSIEKAYLESGEGCLSVLDEHQGYIYRHARIKVKGFDLIQNKDIEVKANGYLAIVFQHELDHFNGTLFYDHINEKDPFYVDEDAIVL